ncbi:MAG: PD-(D/E)XK nuclease family protein [Bacteroidales bacterium]|nr:PD-(D/E)XK nuclease family protein [Bacteroidales bacterium]
MKPFLRYVAEDLIERNLNLSETAIIFPNKRASVFFDKHLYDVLERPFWSPNYLAINEFWSQFSTLQIADSILLNTTLHKVYNRFSKSEETFDEFYFWGELLLRDFDDLDKHLVDAKQLFQNVQTLRAMENPVQYLSEEQVNVLNQFFINFDPEKNSELKEKFVQIWSVLHDVYDQFNQVLKSQNLAYEGLLMRDVIDHKLNDETINLTSLMTTPLPYKNYVFVGFNVLNPAEEKLFKFFKNTQNALFYWDYDESFFKIPNHEAGIFIKRNLENFGNALQNPAIFNNFETSQRTKKITFVASPTENAQTRFADEWLTLRQGTTSETRSLNGFETPEPTENVIVLCNENLLMPLISALSNDDVVNITMGYPVKQMPIVGRIRQILSSYTTNAKLPNIEAKQALPLLIDTLKSELKSDSTATDPLHQEATFRVVLQLNRLADVMQNHQLNLSMQSLQRLIDQMLSVLTVPFSGEPVLGTQIMGVLETRNLDFKNVIMLSVNEGMLPKSANDGSFIPYTLRKAFGMTLPEHKTAVYAYYFFRLMQRAEHIALVYNTATEGLNRGEMSRFMLQLMIENGFEIEYKTLSTSAVELQQQRKIAIPKTSEIRTILLEKYREDTAKSGLSPSAIITFLTCKLKFYLSYVIGLRAKKPDISDIDAAAIGTWFHRSAEILYRKISNQLEFDNKNNFVEFRESLINADDLKEYLDEKKREELVDMAFEKSEYSGEELIVRRLLTDNLKRLILLDIQKAPFTLLAMEKNISEVVNFGDISIKMGGFVDRIDNIDGYLRIVDYKTGGHLKMLKIDKLHDLFDEKKITENRNYLQALIYSFLVSKTSKNRRILPCLLYIHEAHKTDYSPAFLPNDYHEISAEFETCLTHLLQEIFDANTEFDATETPANCRYCDYLDLCKKQGFESWG